MKLSTLRLWKIKEKEAKRNKCNDDVDELIFDFICLKDWGNSTLSHF